jgi:hypothetical protein
MEDSTLVFSGATEEVRSSLCDDLLMGATDNLRLRTSYNTTATHINL